VHWLGYVPETELAALYSGALACILPSLYEGFGLPALEAMACGTPVIISRAGGLPEVAGEAGLYIDPLDAASLTAAMQQIIGDASLRRELSQCGLERARFFTWERTAQATWQVLQGAMQ
jgi:glycosyltransferase involved in cell wall biosynthesis